MSHGIKNFLTALTLMLLSACVVNDGRKEPKAAQIITPIYESGSIFKAGLNERPLYEERRARNIGDGLMMTVAEIPSSVNQSKAKSKPDSTEISSENKRESEDRRRREDGEHGADEESSAGFADVSSELLVGSISMTVSQVLDNGKLVVTGGKLVNIDADDKRYLRISGVVDPRNIADNAVPSTQVAEAEIEIENVRGGGRSNRRSNGNSIFANYFQSVTSRE